MMSDTMKLLLSACCLLFLVSGFGYSQETDKSPSVEATIYVYRNFYHATFGKAAPTITANGEKLAVLDEGRYFVAHVPSGFVVVTSGKKKTNRVEIDARSGETYYIRARAHPGKLFARFELFRVTTEEAKTDSDKLRYVNSNDIKSERVKDAPKGP